MDAQTTQQLFDLWRKQLDEGAQAWSRMVSQAAPSAAPDATAFWRPFAEQAMQAWARTFAQAPMTPDLMAQWKQFLDQSIDAWSRALGQAMNTDQFAQLLGKYLDQWLVTAGPAKKAAEQSIDGALQALNLASRTQLTAVATQIVDLEERLERLEDGIAAVLKRLEGMGRFEAPASKEAP